MGMLVPMHDISSFVTDETAITPVATKVRAMMAKRVAKAKAQSA